MIGSTAGGIQKTGDPYIDEAWDFWAPIIFKRGKLDLNQVRKELADFYFVMHQVPKVYCAVTGDLLSKVNYPADVVIEAFEDYLQRCIDEALVDQAEVTAQ